MRVRRRRLTAIVATALLISGSTEVVGFQGFGSDPTFGAGGEIPLTAAFGASAQVAPLPDGRLLVRLVDGTCVLRRYLPDGSLDPSFSGDGTIAFDAATCPAGWSPPASADDATVVIARSFTGNGTVARFTSSGAPDGGFGADGRIEVSTPGLQPDSVTQTPDGGVLVVSGGGVVPPVDSVLLRYDPDGEPDTTFGGGDGAVPIPTFNAVSIHVDILERIVVVGYTTAEWVALRYTPTGALDNTWSSDGVLALPTTFYGPVTTITADGGLVLLSARDRLLIHRFDTSGALITSFGAGGVATIGFTDLDDLTDTNGDNARPLGITESPDGDIVALGQTYSRAVAVRLDASGMPDPTFGDGGRAVLSSLESAALATLDGDSFVAITRHDAGARLRLRRFVDSLSWPPIAAAPPALQAGFDPVSRLVTATWGPVTSSDPEVVVGYEANLVHLDSGVTEHQQLGQQRTFSLGNPPVGEYRLDVRAVSFHGDGPVSSVDLTVGAPPPPPPSPPTPSSPPPPPTPTAEVFAALETPRRAMDTRPTGTTDDTDHQRTGRLAAGTTYRLPLAGRLGLPTTATNANITITATNPEQPGYITAYPCTTPRPTTSTLNYTTGTTVATTTTTKLDTAGHLCIYTHATTDVIIDITGHHTTGP